MAETADITLWLDAARDGDRAALDRVLATLYQELHTMARRQLAGQQGHTLDATALVHEAYLKLIGRNAAEVVHPAQEDGTPLTRAASFLSQCYASGSQIPSWQTTFWSANRTPVPVECTV